MIDDRPYIIVDNRKIAPIEPSPGFRRPTGDRKKSDDQPFGIVDRVTISKEARERFRQQNTPTGPTPALHTTRPERPAVGGLLLTYAPKR